MYWLTISAIRAKNVTSTKVASSFGFACRAISHRDVPLGLHRDCGTVDRFLASRSSKVALIHASLAIDTTTKQLAAARVAAQIANAIVLQGMHRAP